MDRFALYRQRQLRSDMGVLAHILNATCEELIVRVLPRLNRAVNPWDTGDTLWFLDPSNQ